MVVHHTGNFSLDENPSRDRPNLLIDLVLKGIGWLQLVEMEEHDKLRKIGFISVIFLT
jgi:hypothetical protein